MLKAANLRPFHKCFRNKGIAEKNIADSTYKQEEHNEVMQFEKLCLNVCPFRRLSPNRSLVISLNLKGLYIYIKALLGTGWPIFNTAVFKDNKDLTLQGLESEKDGNLYLYLFISVYLMADEKG